MKLDLKAVKPRALAVRTIADATPALREVLGMETARSALGLITATSDDALWSALDQGTKASPAEVVYAKSFYAGAGYPSGPLSGECIGIYAADTPDEIDAALGACLAYLEREAWFYAADEAGALTFYPHVITAAGRFLAPQAKILPGEPMAYLIAPPLESVVGVDAACKAARVRMTKWFGPPSETNYGGAYLVGEQPSCEAAARAFAAAVLDVSRTPHAGRQQARGAGEDLAARGGSPDRALASSRPPAADGAGAPARAGRFQSLDTGERFARKPDHLTHLVDDASLVRKTHPRIVLRGKIDLLQAALLDAQGAADAEGASALVGEVGELLELSRALMGAEVTGRPLPELRLLGMGADAVRDATHHTHELYGVPFMYPHVRHGPVVARLGLARAIAREAEVAALAAFAADTGGPTASPARPDLCLALNRMSSAIYLLTCKYVAGRYPGVRPPPGPTRGWRPPE